MVKIGRSKRQLDHLTNRWEVVLVGGGVGGRCPKTVGDRRLALKTDGRFQNRQ